MPLGIVIPGFGGVYDPTVEYEFYVWVRDGYNVFISTKAVPPGTPTSNEEYWFQASSFDDLIELSDMVTKAEFTAHTTDTNIHVTPTDRERLDAALPSIIYGTTGSVSQITVPDMLAGASLDVTARCVAKQEGAGDPSPENVRAFVGRNTLDVTQTGKNIGLVRQERTVAFNGITFTQNSDGSITANGTTTTSSDTGSSIATNFDLPDGVKVTLSGGYSNALRVGIGQVTASGVWRGTPKYTEAVPTTFTTSRIDKTDRWRMYVQINGAGVTVDNVTFYPQLELGSTATAYEPYAATTYPVALPETLYGLPNAPDEVRNDGAAIKRTKLITFDGTESWARVSTGIAEIGRFMLALGTSGKGPSTASKLGNIASSQYIGITPDQTYRYGSNLPDRGLALSTSGAALYLFDVDYTDTASLARWKSYLAAQYAAGTPVTVLYELAEPVTLTIDPLIIPALPGDNNVYADGGGDTSTGVNVVEYLRGSGGVELPELADVAYSGKYTDLIDPPTIPTEAADIGAEPARLQFTDTLVLIEAWEADATYEGYGYHAAVPLEGVTASTIPDVVFSLPDAVGGSLGPVSVAYDGGIYLYAKTVPDADITIPTIVVWR